MKENYLKHHGVLGQKWGVRRYQNKDGSRTTEGRQRLLHKQSYYTIPSGTKVFRAVSNGSTNFMNRKYAYVNITDHYYEHSYNTSSGFEGRFDSDVVMKTTKPLKIASTEEYFKALCDSGHIDYNVAVKDIPEDVINKGRYYIQNLADHKLIEGDGGGYKAMNNVVDILKAKGFNGVVDPIDGSHQLNRGKNPIATVLFDPGESVEITDIYRLW